MKTALITGASSGYGKATAELFLKRGWNVIATMRKPEASSLPAFPDRLRVVALDVTEHDSVAAALRTGISAFGAIDVLVNNAGIGGFGPFEAMSMASVRQLFETNTLGTMAMTQAIIPHMRQRGAGAIINVTSSVCFAPMPLVAAYTASKYAIEGFSESLAYELATLDIRIKLVEPGYGPSTQFTANGANRICGLDLPDYQKYAGQVLGMRRTDGPVTTPELVAGQVLAAAADYTPRLRFPAGPDSEYLANSRWTKTDEEFLSGMRSMFAPAP